MSGERAPVKVVKGKWACDVGVAAKISLQLVPAPSLRRFEPVLPLPAHIATIAEACERNRWETWPPVAHHESNLQPAPYMRDLGRYFRGSFREASYGSCDPTKQFPASFHFQNADGRADTPWGNRRPPRELPPLPQPPARTVSRVRLDLATFLRTRGSHCRRDCGEILSSYWAKDAPCDCHNLPRPVASFRPANLPSPEPCSSKCAISCCSCDDPQRTIPPNDCVEVSAVWKYLTARRAELADQTQRMIDERAEKQTAMRKQYEKKLEHRQKAKEARARKREDKDEQLEANGHTHTHITVISVHVRM